MESRTEIFDYLNKLISEEQGMPVTAQDKLLDAGLDSLGMTFFLMSVDGKYRILHGIPNGKEYEMLGLQTITMKELVNLCKKSLLETPATTE